MLLRFVLSLSLLSLSLSAQNPTPKFELDNFYMAIMSIVPGFDQTQAGKQWKSHQAHWQGLAKNGDLTLGGPVTGQDGTIAAVLIYRAKDQDEAVTIAGNDPLVQREYGRQGCIRG